MFGSSLPGPSEFLVVRIRVVNASPVRVPTAASSTAATVAATGPTAATWATTTTGVVGMAGMDVDGAISLGVDCEGASSVASARTCGEFRMRGDEGAIVSIMVEAIVKETPVDCARGMRRARGRRR